MSNKDKTSYLDFLWYALYAFAGLGIELVLVGAVEPILFGGVSANYYSTVQKIIHLIITIVCWGGIGWALIRGAKNKLGFDVLGCDEVKRVNAILSMAAVIVCIILNFLDWKTLKIIGEFQSKEPIVFISIYLLLF